MTTKLPRKLLSCLLVLAICITTVFGCLMTVSAATASYEFGSGSIDESLTEATIDVTFTPPTDVAALADGTYMAEFMLNEVDTDGLVLQSVAVEAIAPGSISLDTIGLSYNSEGLADGEIAYIVFDSATAFTSVKLKLTFGFAGGAAVKGNEYKMSINSVTYTGRYEGDTYTETASANGVIKTGCDHIITIDDQSVLVDTDSVNGYSVYTNSVCSVCGERFDYQVIPTAVPSDEKVICWDGTYHNGATSFDDVLDGDGSEANPYIIDSADDLALVVRGSVPTTNKHFKVADGIDAIVLQKEAYAQDIMNLKTSENVRSYFEGGNIPELDLLTWTNGGWSASNKFAGFFDGNGATIYGLYCDKSTEDYTVGLFGKIDTSADNKTITFKNITLKNAYMKALTMVGGIVACANSSNGITLEGCTVANSYIRHYLSQSRSDAESNKASVMASRWAGTITVNNCLVYGNDALNVAMVNAAEDCIGYPLSMITNTNVSMSNVVCLGTTPYDKYGSSYNFVRLTTSPFSNVYTDQPVDEYTYYLNGDTKAIILISEKMSSALQNSFTAATMAEVKTQDFVTTFNENAGSEVLAVDVNGGYPTFAKDVAKIDSTENVLYYNNGGPNSDFITNAAEGVGDTPDNPYIITTANELMVITKNRLTDNSTKASDTNFAGKYFKIADGIDVMVLQPTDKVDYETIKALSTPEEVKAYFDSKSPVKWWAGDLFAGHFDGNGVEIYGMYAPNALFPKVEQGATIKNVTVKNSCVDTTGSGGALIGYIDGGSAAGNVTVENSVIANCYVYRSAANDNETVGVVCGTYNGSAGLIINNVLTYNNTVINYNTSTAVTTVRDCLYGSLNNTNPGDEGETEAGYDNQFSNSIFLDCTPSAYSGSKNASKHGNYTNVYTDKDSFDRIASWSNAAQLATNITVIEDPDSIKGIAGSSVVTALNTVNGATVWAATANGYPTPMAAYADTINPVSSIDINLEAVNLTYNNDGSFNLNFHYEPAYTGFAPQLYVAQADLSGFIKLEAQASSMANNGLSADALMYVIENLSAREIGDTLLPTVVASSGNTALWGKTEQMSIADYAVAVINGEGYYTDTTDETIIQQDKNVAAAVINYGEAAKAALSQGYDGNAAGGTTIYWDGTTSVPADSDNDGVYEITKASELAYIAENANSDTAGKTYKVADGISAIVLQKEATINSLGGLSKLTGLSAADDVKKYYEDNASSLTQWVVSSSYTAGFAGTFDGNGATIYGMYHSSGGCYGGLFSGAGALTIKNVALRNNYVYGDAAAIICAFTNTSGNFTVNNTVIANNVVISNRNDNAMTYGGVMFGSAGNGKLLVDGCLVYGNIAKHTTYSVDYYKGVNFHDNEYDITYGLWGSMNRNDSTQNTVISNSIILDAAPYALNYSWAGQNQNTYTNVYTNMTGMTITNTDWAGTGTTSNVYKTVTTINSDGTTKIEFYNAGATSATYTLDKKEIYKIEHADVLGSAAATNCPNLDWSKWAYGMSGEYPTPITSATEAAGRIEYWDGSYHDGVTSFGEVLAGDGSETNPYIIETAADLAFVSKSTVDSAGKYFKVADGIDAIILQPESDAAKGIMELTSADAVKTYFTDGSIENPVSWVYASWNPSTPFVGNFDGNGVEIYGLYANTPDNTNPLAGLFTHIDAGAVISNVTVKNAYINSAAFAAGIAAYSESNSQGLQKAGTVTFKQCAVINSYIASHVNNATNKAAVMLGNMNDLIDMSDCIVYGNIARNVVMTNVEDGTGYELSLVGSLTNTADADKIDNCIVLGTEPYPLYNMGFNSLVNGSPFENTYTDKATEDFYLYRWDGSAWVTYSNLLGKAMSGLVNIDAADAVGAAAKNAMPTLDWATTDGGVWYTGNAWGYPSFEKAGVMPTANQMAYDALTMTNYDAYTATDLDFSMYATSLNLKANPYIAFTFAFNKDYKTNRDKITVTFTTASGKTVTTTVADENGNLNAGWTNNAGAGRYHLYRFDSVPVKDLCEPITVTVKYGDNAAVEFGKFSVEGFALDIQNAYKQDPCQYYATRVEAAKALLYYTQMINARYA